MINGFTVKNIRKKLALMPTEDSYSFDSQNHIFSVADGITRDPMRLLPDINTLFGKIDFALFYPRIRNPARKASRIFSTTFPEVVLDFDKPNRNEGAIRAGFDVSNKIIGVYSDTIKHIDYVKNDLPGCVAAGSFVNDDVLYWGYISDCGIAVFNRKGEMKFKTKDEGPGPIDSFFWKDGKISGLKWANPLARATIRETYRNNPKQNYSYGALTGQKEAIHYLRTGYHELNVGDKVITYTDGLIKTINSDEFAFILSDQSLPEQIKITRIEDLCSKNVESEGTLVYYSHY